MADTRKDVEAALELAKEYLANSVVRLAKARNELAEAERDHERRQHECIELSGRLKYDKTLKGAKR